MNLEDKVEYLKMMGFNEELANYYANKDEESNDSGIIAGLRFLRSINASLEYTKTCYAKHLELNLRNITEIEKNLLNCGVTPNLLAEFKYSIEKDNIYQILYNISDYQSCDYDNTSSNEYINACKNAPYVKLVEMINGEMTGRYIPELHDLVPFEE